MVEAGTLCINADVVKMAGIKASATTTADTYTNVYIKMAEGLVCGASRYDWVTNYASVSAIGKEFLRTVTAAYAAWLAIDADTSGWASKQESQVALDVTYVAWSEGINFLREDKNRKFILTGVVA